MMKSKIVPRASRRGRRTQRTGRQKSSNRKKEESVDETHADTSCAVGEKPLRLNSADVTQYSSADDDVDIVVGGPYHHRSHSFQEESPLDNVVKYENCGRNIESKLLDAGHDILCDQQEAPSFKETKSRDVISNFSENFVHLSSTDALSSSKRVKTNRRRSNGRKRRKKSDWGQEEVNRDQHSNGNIKTYAAKRNEHATCNENSQKDFTIALPKVNSLPDVSESLVIMGTSGEYRQTDREASSHKEERGEYTKDSNVKEEQGELDGSNMNDTMDTYDSSSDEELLDPSLNAVKKDERHYKKGDLVWAKHQRSIFWPAVVKRMILSKSHSPKVIVEFLNYGFGSNSFKYNLQRVKPFNCELKTQIMEEGERSSIADDFMKAVREGEQYLISEALESQPRLGESPEVEPLNSHNENGAEVEAVNEILTPSLESPTPLPDCHSALPECPIASPESLSPPSPEIIVGFQDSPNPEMLAKKQKLVKKWDKVQDSLLRYIKKDITKEHLLKIFLEQKKCERHSLFVSSKKGRDSLKYTATIGPFINDDKLEDVVNHLTEIFRQNCMEDKQTLPNISYILEVWLPEALIFAVQKSRGIGRKKAEIYIAQDLSQVWSDIGPEIDS